MARRSVFDAIARRLDPEVARAVLRAIARTQSGVNLVRLEAALARGDLTAAAAAIPWESVGARQLQAEVVRQLAAGTQAGAQAAVLPRGIPLRFGLVERRAVDWAANQSARLVARVSARTREGIRAIVSRALQEGGAR